MKIFDLYSPNAPLPQQALLRRFISPQKKNGQDFYFVKDDGYLIIYREKIHTYPHSSPYRPGESELISNQIEVPFSAVRWFINVIEQKFFRAPEEGGLPAGKISFKEKVDGENLHVMRVAHAGCEQPGYDITNLDRVSHISDTSNQATSFSDPWLFQGGLIDFLKAVADKYEKGQL